MVVCVQQVIYAYITMALCICLLGWTFEKLGIFPHAVYLSARVGRCSCYAIGTAILAVALIPILSAGYPEFRTAIETGMLIATGIAIWYSFVHIHASYIQISVMWKAFKRLEAYVYTHMGELDQERYAAYVEGLRADELFNDVDPQYHELYDHATIKLAIDIGLM